MSTTVHIPKPLRDEVDRRALKAETTWSPGFLAKLTPLAPAAAELDSTVDEVVARRRSKLAPRL
jgi:hypothetical protein